MARKKIKKTSIPCVKGKLDSYEKSKEGSIFQTDLMVGVQLGEKSVKILKIDTERQEIVFLEKIKFQAFLMDWCFSRKYPFEIVPILVK